MKDWKSIGKKIVYLPIWLNILLVIFSAAALIIVFVKGWTEQPIAYAVYVFSFYTLVTVVFAGGKTIPGYYKAAKKKVYQNPYANRYLTDVAYKTNISLYISLGINLVYVVTNVVSAVWYRTSWFSIFAVYYGIMAVMRFLLVHYVRRHELGSHKFDELKRARACAYILMLVNLTLSGVVLMMVYHNRGFHYQGVLIYVMAMYTFYVTASAIIDMVKYRKYNSPVMSLSKIIKFAASLFSMLFLETAMFSQFGQDTPEQTKRIMIMTTGAGISVLVVGMSVYMIIRSSKEIKEYKRSVKNYGK